MVWRAPFLKHSRGRVLSPGRVLDLLANHLESVAMMLDGAATGVRDPRWHDALWRLYYAAAWLRGKAVPAELEQRAVDEWRRALELRLRAELERERDQGDDK